MIASAQATTLASVAGCFVVALSAVPLRGIGLVDSAPIACSIAFITHRPWCQHPCASTSDPDLASRENFTFALCAIDSCQVHEHTSCGTDKGSPYPLSRIAGFASDHVVGSSGSASGHHISLPCTLAALIHSSVPCYSVVMLMGCTPG